METDDELFAALRGGDPSAFETLYLRYESWVVSLAFRFTGDREDALDVLQDTFAYLLRKGPALELRCEVKSFLYPVVKHLALSRKESRRRQRPLERTPSSPTPPGELPLAGLSEAQQEVVLLRFVDGLDLQAIADALEVPLGTVKSRLHSAIEILRRRLPNR